MKQEYLPHKYNNELPINSQNEKRAVTALEGKRESMKSIIFQGNFVKKQTEEIFAFKTFSCLPRPNTVACDSQPRRRFTIKDLE